MGWFLYDNGLRHERVKGLTHFMPLVSFYTLEENQKSWRFSDIFGVIERD